MSFLDDMKAKTKLAQEELARTAGRVSVDGFWDPLVATFNLALRAGNEHAAARDQLVGELDQAGKLLTQAKAAADREKQRSDGLVAEAERLKERVRELEAHETNPVVVSERMAKRAAQLDALKRQAEALAAAQAVDQAVADKAKPSE